MLDHLAHAAKLKEELFIVEDGHAIKDDRVET